MANLYMYETPSDTLSDAIAQFAMDAERDILDFLNGKDVPNAVGGKMESLFELLRDIVDSFVEDFPSAPRRLEFCTIANNGENAGKIIKAWLGEKHHEEQFSFVFWQPSLAERKHLISEVTRLAIEAGNLNVDGAKAEPLKRPLLKLLTETCPTMGWNTLNLPLWADGKAAIAVMEAFGALKLPKHAVTKISFRANHLTMVEGNG